MFGVFTGNAAYRGISIASGGDRISSGSPVAGKWRSGDEPNWCRGVCCHSRIPSAEDLAQIVVHHLGADLQQQVSASLGPLHLLLVYHAAADVLVP
jgi:hypothetical protein